MNIFFTVAVAVGFICALSFTTLYAHREKLEDGTKAVGWWTSPAGRLIMADSLVLVMLYLSGILTRLLPHWHLSEEFRVFLTLFAVSVVVWRLIFLIKVRTGKKENTK